MKKIAAFGLAATILATPAMASTYGVELRGHVPVTCHVKGDAPVADIAEEAVDLGAIREFCNNGAGYDLYLDHSPQMAGAVVLIDGAEFELGSEGSVALAGEAGPAIQSRNVRIDLSEVEDTANLAIAFRIVPR